jgi:hypothetical protein
MERLNVVTPHLVSGLESRSSLHPAIAQVEQVGICRQGEHGQMLGD